MPSIEIVDATIAQKPIFEHLLELYRHDFSVYDDEDVGDDGLYGYPHLDRYWTEPDRHPYLLRVDGRLAGFALVRRGSQFVGGEAWEMSEFFVLGRFRRKGVGRRAAWRLFDEPPGPWEVAEMDYNRPAQTFWRRTIGAYTGERYQESRARLHGMDFVVQRFAAPGAAPCP